MKANYRIKNVKGDLSVLTEGMSMNSMLKKKSDLQLVLNKSLAHKRLLEIAITTKRGSNPLLMPSTDSSSHLEKAFYLSVKHVTENLILIEGLDIEEAICQGNSLATGNPIVADSPVVMSQIKDAMRYLSLL